MKKQKRVAPEKSSAAARKDMMRAYLVSTRSDFALSVQKAGSLGNNANGVLAGPVLRAAQLGALGAEPKLGETVMAKDRKGT